jgi:hypothetical protein
MQNVIVEFLMPSGTSHVTIINRDAFRETDKHPIEARMAAAIDMAMESDEKTATVSRRMYDASMNKNPNFPCEVVDHVVLVVKD